MVKLTKAEQVAYDKLSLAKDWVSGYELGVRYTVLDRLVVKGLVNKRGGVGQAFSPNTTFRYKTRPEYLADSTKKALDKIVGIIKCDWVSNKAIWTLHCKHGFSITELFVLGTDIEQEKWLKKEHKQFVSTQK